MSLQWHKLIRLHVGVPTVQAVLLSHWPSRQVLARIACAIETDDEAPQAGAAASGIGPGVRFAMDSVLAELHDQEPGKNVQLDVLLSDEYVHFDVATGDYAGLSKRQLQAIAESRVAERFGGAADYMVRAQLQPDLRHLLVCAIARRDADAIFDMAADHRLKLHGLRPEFCMKWNKYCHKMSEACGVFASADTGHAIVACASRNAITAIRGGVWAAEPTGDGPVINARTLDDRVDRLLSSAGLDVRALSDFILVAPGATQQALSPRWSVVDWNLDWEREA